jgi:hypothetical protein
MLVRILAVPALAVLAGCGHSYDSKLVGSWQWRGCDDAGDVTYSADHTFTTKEWPVTYTHQPPILYDTGQWHLRGGRLIVDFKGDTHAAKHSEFPLAFFDRDTFVIRTAEGKVHSFERVK